MNLTGGLEDRLRFFFNRLRERLWVRPLLLCVLSVFAVFVAKMADFTSLAAWAPNISVDTLETLLSIIASSMLVIATFAVASMVSAYASASSTATPRAFSLVVADDVSQNALSTFIGAFIFSIVGLIALLNDIYGLAGRFTLFAATLLVFAIVIMTFVRWVDRIARLGRVSNTIDKVEAAAADAIRRRAERPFMGGAPADGEAFGGVAVFSPAIGYVQRVDVKALQELAETHDLNIRVASLPGTFASPDRPLALVRGHMEDGEEDLRQCTVDQFIVGDARTFDEDPRFGLVVLSEIASRALSPAVNDPGTAIDTINALVRLFALWVGPQDQAPDAENQRVQVPQLNMDDMFDDAFSAIARDGAGVVEVMVRLQKAYRALLAMGHPAMNRAAAAQSRAALARSDRSLTLESDLQAVQALARSVALQAEGEHDEH